MPSNDESKKDIETRSESADDRSSGAADGSAVRIVVPEKLDLRISLEGIPNALASAVENLAKPAKPAPRLRTFLKDYLPALTPIATVVISVAVSVYTYKANDHRSTEALDQIISVFGGNNDDRARAIAAIRLAAYGEKALPAVRMVLGSDDPQLRSGGVLVAEQMYRAETVNHEELTKKMLGYYSANDRLLRRGVLEWLVEMEHQLSDDEGRLAYDMLKQSFGPHGELCAAQDETVALEAANFLFIWSFTDSKDLVLGLARECRDSTQPDKFEGARQSAVNTIPKLAKTFSMEQRASLLKDDLPGLRKAAPELNDLIDQAVARIQNPGTTP
jgi:hypothetical protein